MATLIAVYTNDGCVGQCDARCYNAKGPDCDCICGGANHGKGLEQAIENTRERVAAEVRLLEKKGEVAVAVNAAALREEHAYAEGPDLFEEMIA